MAIQLSTFLWTTEILPKGEIMNSKMQAELYQNMLSSYPDVLEIKDIVKILKISKPLAYRLIKSGRIKSCKVGREYKIAKCYFFDFLVTSSLGGNN